jgi:hypothetical protein
MLFVQMVFPARKKNRFASLFSDQRFLAKNMLRHSYDGAEAFVRKFFVRTCSGGIRSVANFRSHVPRLETQ